MNIPKSKKAIATKKRILESAKLLFMKNGIHGTSVQEIVRGANVAKGTFYLYYETKEDVVLNFFEDSMKMILGNIEKIPLMDVSKESVNVLIDRIIDEVEKNMKMMKLLHEARFNDYFRPNQTTKILENSFIHYIRVWLKEGVKKGEIQIKDTDFYAVYIFTSIHEILDLYITDQINFNCTQIKVNLKSICQKILFGGDSL